MPNQPLTSYTIQFDVPLAAKPKSVWKAMTKRIDEWWPDSFHSSEKTKAFVMECEVGGRVYEDQGGSDGAEWGRLVVFQTNEKLVWTGTHFGKAGKNWGHFFVSIVLEATEDGTLLKFVDTGYGLLDEKMPGTLEEGWKELYSMHLKHYVETR
jgi:uncharacterized protein YndB with AHSA1/START domain